MIVIATVSKPTWLARAIALALACAAIAGTTESFADDEVGKRKAGESCVACHGPEGNKPITPETPRLAGQQYDYLVQSLTAYRKGTRDDAVMGAMAKALSEKEVRELALYFSRQQGLVTKR